MSFIKTNIVIFKRNVKNKTIQVVLFFNQLSSRKSRPYLRFASSDINSIVTDIIPWREVTETKGLFFEDFKIS